MGTIRVHTTQNVTLEYEAASIGSRIVAAIIDNLIMGAWFGAVAVLISSLMGSSSSTLSAWIIGLLVGIPIVFYHLACEVFFNGQSLGKKARHIRVVRLDGTAPRFGDYVLRWLLRLIDTGIGSGLVAVITIAANGKGQRLGDLAAGTTVIDLRPAATPLYQPGAAAPVGYQPVFPQAADLSDHDVALLRQLLGRGLKQENYLVLNETATKIKQLLHIQSDLSDETFLRTILRDHAHLAAAE
ncbi:RDD family protein [Hymenobacter sp. HMF4947]|uniref:RDD family protein n=1 Tax=Hymenobacter ginkgonis TaxID=2682976 RepID=A0A7K1TJF0_9BACT|nr:RDD family protein [Hymenobacter ginkgonis]MVN78525.1 RDD family protein [Hymenobacter ginkgonis]